MAQRIKTVQESDLRMLGALARSIQRVLPVTQEDIDAAAALGKGWVVTRVFEVTDPLDNLRGGTQLVIRQNSVLPGQSVQRVLLVSGPGGQTVVVRGSDYIALPDAIANSLSYVKAFGGTEQRNLPDGYIERQFIYMLDGSYLLTDIVPTYDGRIEMDFQTTSVQSGATSYLGGRSDSYPAGLRLGTGSGNNRLVVTAFSNSAYTAATDVENNTRYKFTFNNKVATLESGGTTLFTNTFTGENANGAALVINGLNNAGTITANLEGIYLYSFKAWNGQGELVMNLVPAVQRGTVPVVGFYDTVSETFMTATAGTFAAGGEAVPTPDAPMDIVSNNGVLKYGVLGKNLFNVSANPLEQGGIASSDGQNTATSYNQRARTNGYIPVKPSTVYTASVKDLQIYYLEYTQDTTYTDRHSSGFADNSVTFTTGANTYFIRLQFRNSNNSNIQPSEVTNVQLEQGSTATEYEPYREGVYADGTVETIGIRTRNLYDANSNKAFVEENTQYTVSLIKTAARVNIAAYDTNDTLLEVVATWSSAQTGAQQTTFTTPENTKYIACATGLDLVSNVQIEQGSTATDYVPYYNGGTATAEMLLKVGDYQDVQSIIDGVVTRNVGVKVLDGTENWAYSAGWSDTTHKCFYATLDSIKQQLTTSNECLCSHFEWYSRDDLYADKTIIGGCISGYTPINPESGKALTVRVSSSIAESDTDFTQWLADQYAAGTPVIVVYPLATPTTESVAGQTLQVTDGDNVLEITQASLNNLELEAEYQAAVSLTIQEVQDANLDPNVQVTIN